MKLWSDLVKRATGRAEPEAPYVVVRLPARFSRATEDAASEDVWKVLSLDACQAVIVDCSGCRHIDSFAIGSLVERRNRALQRGAKFILAAPDERLRHTFEITKLHRVFTIHESVAEAIAASAANRPAMCNVAGSGQ
jgi:anti-sigma B factor antagonist